MPPPTPRACEYVTFYGKRDFIHVIKLKILGWGGSPGLFGWVPCNHRNPWKGGKSVQVKEGDMTMETEVRMSERARKPKTVGASRS